MKIFFIFFFVLFSFLVHSCLSNNMIMRTQSMRDGDVIFSEGKRFAFGFFSLGTSNLRYVGIWYAQVSEQTVVWVANRDHPINDTSGHIKFSSRGNLCVYASVNGTEPIWSTDVLDTISEPALVAKLSDLGNLVLLDPVTGKSFWESFNHPTNTLLPFMKFGYTRQDGVDRFMTSWRSPGDPGFGNVTYRIERRGFPQMMMYKGTTLWWRTGSWTGQRWSGVPEMTNKFIFNISFVNSPDEVSITYGVLSPLVITRMVLNETGTLQRFTWNGKDKKWIGFWSAPEEKCDSYNHCGLNGYCDTTSPDKFECSCLPGHEPKTPQAWNLRDASDGCKRSNAASICNGREGFAKLKRVKVPNTSGVSVDMNITLKECEKRCLRNCSCVAYASAYHESEEGAKGCLTWHGDMLDTRTYLSAGQDFYLRVDKAELARWNGSGSSGKLRIFFILISMIVVVVLLVIMLFCFIKKRRQAIRHKKPPSTFAPSSFDIEEPFGVLENVKRLSKNSGQGMEEFKNEVKLISKLQHRNLVRILGCCVESEEKMLIYEYLPNKSLDCFIFREEHRAELDWSKRMGIIRGIARGILYLHQDSRLRIIHRDLKASNVLLDNEMIPKIADFGMARIFGGNQIEGSTNRVVGTYGYMSPEYAMDGQFSIKSDVYSFGILILEIITGKKNSAIYNENSNLVGHIWGLWEKGEAREIIDTLMDAESYEENEVMKCVHIGLLCVQESASDRPDMSSVVFMLGHNAIDLPSPKHPAFTVGRKRNVKNGGSSGNWPSGETGSSVNDVTLTDVQGR
ncbi:hypothetical protein YC2023_069830 [Brassica napus]